MLDSVFALRLALVVIGVVIIAGVYLWSTPRPTRRARYLRSAADTREDEAPADTDDPLGAADDDWVIQKLPSKAARSETPTTLTRVLVDEREVEDLPQVSHDQDEDVPAPPKVRRERPPGRVAPGQLDFGFSSAPDTEADEADEAATASPAPAPPDPEPGELLTLFIRPLGDGVFAGPDIVRASNKLGLRFGDMNIFHHFGAGELTTRSSLFSVANMFEPGTFDLHQIETFSTRGLVLFLQLPAPLEGPVAFEFFLNGAQRLAESLNGELCGTPSQRLSSAMIERMRNTAREYGQQGR